MLGSRKNPQSVLPGHVPKESKINAQLPSDKTCYVAWTSNAQSEAELALSGAYLQTFRLERHGNHHLETSYQEHLLSSLVSILPVLQPCWVQGKTHRASCPVMCQKNCATHATQAIKITHNFHLTRRAMWHGHLALNQKQNWLVSGAYLQTFRLERHRNHYLETSYQAHLLSSLVSILPALQPCWVQGKTYRACCPVMCQKNRATHATQAIKNNAQLPSDKTCYVAWTSSSQSEAELACIWCLSSDTFRLERHRNHHLETSYQVHLLSSLVSILPALQPCWVQGKTHRACCPVIVPKESKIRHHFHLTRRAMWHGHLTLNQKQNWLYLVLIFRHSDWSGTEIIILRLHIKCIFCQAWFQFYLPCNHVGFKEKPTERAARSCAKRIVQLMLPKPSKITHNFHLTRRAMWHGHLDIARLVRWKCALFLMAWVA